VDKVLVEPAPVAVVSAYGESAVQYSLRVWVKSADYWDVYFQVNKRVKTIFEEQGIAMTYPHLNVHLQQ
jgi:small conductance mechanosensitive channel